MEGKPTPSVNLLNLSKVVKGAWHFQLSTSIPKSWVILCRLSLVTIWGGDPTIVQVGFDAQAQKPSSNPVVENLPGSMMEMRWAYTASVSNLLDVLRFLHSMLCCRGSERVSTLFLGSSS